MTDHYAVLGNPVAHSLSPAIQQAAFDVLGIDASYTALRVDSDEFPGVVERLRRGTLAGANVTMPHKHLAFELADRVAGDAARAQSVNTFVRTDSGVFGMSTDIPAIRSEWSRKGLPEGTALILGSGGAAAAALVALSGMPLYVSARSPERLSRLLDQTGTSAIAVPWSERVPGAVVVNATPLGMRGESLPNGLLVESEGVFDMAYGPLPTPAIITARTLGLPSVDGIEMLVAQAALSFEAWTAAPAPFDVMLAAAQIAQGW